MHNVEIFTAQRLNAANARVRRSAVMLAATILTGILLSGLGIGLRQQWLCVCGLIAGAWAAYYLLDTQLRPIQKEAAFVSHMLGVQPGKMAVQWGGVSPESVYVEGVQAREIRCSKDGAVKVFYLRAEDEPPQIREGTEVRIESVDRFIVRILPADR